LARRWYGLKWVIVITFSLILISCGAEIKDTSYEKEAAGIKKLLKSQVELTNRERQKLMMMQRKRRLLSLLKPIVSPQVNPLNQRITMSFRGLSYEKVFYFLAVKAGLNLVLDPALNEVIPSEDSKITFTFKDMTIKDILDEICRVLDITYQVKNGVLWVKPFAEKFIALDFLPFTKSSSLNIGGDVLGGGGSQEGINNPLTGQFTITGSIEKGVSDIYSQIATAVKSMLSKNGIYIINRSLGLLYVKDRPSRVRAVEEYISKLRKEYLKQVILDVKIVEVNLSKNVNRGIDWLQLTNYLMGNNHISLKSLSAFFSTQPTSQNPVQITISGTPSINAVLNFLAQYGKLRIVSNPIVRVLNNQPALISVGTSIAYIKKIEKQTTSEGGATSTSMTIDTSSLFQGILLGITPHVTANDTVILQVVPIKSDILSLDKAEFENGDYFVTLPKVNLREMTTLIKTKPGDLVIIGGLILEKKGNNENRLEIPLLDRIFRSNQLTSSKTELVILIRVRVD